MSKVRFIADLHLGHQNRAGEGIVTWNGKDRGGVTTIEEHDQWIVDQWNSVTSKHDLVMVLGDVCFDKSKLALLKKMKGSKHLLFGNHDKFSLAEYLKYFDKVHGFMKYKGKAWLSHAPIDPGSLRGKWNIHGHTHEKSKDDLRYICVSVEAVSGQPVSWDDLELLMEDRKCLMKMSSNYNLSQPNPNPKTEFSITGALTADTAETSGDSDSED